MDDTESARLFQYHQIKRNYKVQKTTHRMHIITNWKISWKEKQRDTKRAINFDFAETGFFGKNLHIFSFRFH